jgi:transcriptional regulator with XRE-family HTH domain
MLTPAQLRAARALLGWSQEDLAEKCGGVSHLSTIKRFESGKSDRKQSTLLAWRKALSKAGVVRGRHHLRRQRWSTDAQRRGGGDPHQGGTGEGSL